MRSLLKRFRSDEDGSVLVLVALVLTAMMGFAALGTDVGMLVVERQRLSTVADAAALSGAQFLPEAPDLAADGAQTILRKNGLDPALSQVVISEDHHRVRVSLSKTVPLAFARLLGKESSDVVGRATALTANLSAYYGAAPIGVPRADWQIGQQVNLKLDAQDGTISPGNYQALALGKSGASSYENNLMYGYDAWIRQDEWVDTQTGNMAGPSIRAVNYRIGLDPAATATTYNRQSPRLVVVPVLEDFNVNGKGQVHVVGFATFFLEQAIDYGNERGAIVGRFVKLIVEGEGSTMAPDFGARTTKIIQ